MREEWYEWLKHTWKTSMLTAFIDTISVINAYAIAGWLFSILFAAAGVVCWPLFNICTRVVTDLLEKTDPL